MNTINPKLLGGMEYPYLSQLKWTLNTYKVADKAAMDEFEAVHQKALCWVKDDQVNALIVEGFNDAQAILNKLGLEWDFSNPSVASKRMSRLMRPYRYWTHLNTCNIVEDESIDGDVWDGVYQISRQFLLKTQTSLSQLSPARQRLFTDELNTCNRWEITLITSNGQFKGHAFVTDLPYGVDLRAPKNSAKKQLKMKQGVFFGVNPIHHHDELRLDIQSLINHMNVYGSEQLQKWLTQKTDAIYAMIKSGDAGGIANMLFNSTSAEAIDSVERWPVGAYLASKGNPLWFGKACLTAGDQYVEQLISTNKNMRWPVASAGRYYIAPSSVVGMHIPVGQAHLDPNYSSLFIADEDWKNWVAKRLGGCDGDDSLLIQQATYNGIHQMMVWRNPNQFGEYAIFEASKNSHELVWLDGSVWPEIDLSKAATPLEQQQITYGEINILKGTKVSEYNTKALWATIKQAQKNLGTLGSYVNMLMLNVAVHGAVPNKLPATLESVIDCTVKEMGDLTPVKSAISKMAYQLIKNPIPKTLINRVAGLIRDDVQIIECEHHMIDDLYSFLTERIAQFQEDIRILSLTASPPVELYEAARPFMKKGERIRYVYNQHIREMLATVDVPTNRDFKGVEDIVLKELNKLQTLEERRQAMLGAAVRIYTDTYDDKIKDSVLWMPELGRLFIAALREIGLIACPVWLDSKVKMQYTKDIDDRATQIARLNGYWYNMWRQEHDMALTPMGQIPVEVRNQYKRRAADSANALIGVKLTRQQEGERVVFCTQDKVVGYLQKGLECNFTESNYQVINVRVEDGNLIATTTITNT